MEKKENGFTYPLTLMMLLLFLLFFSMKIEWLVSERKMSQENSLIMLEEYYYLSSVRKIEKLYQSGSIIPAKSTIVFEKGSMVFQSDKPIGTSQSINFTLHLNTGETVIARGYFDINSKKLTKWLELK